MYHGHGNGPKSTRPADSRAEVHGCNSVATRCTAPGVWYRVPGTGIHIHLLQFHFCLKRGGLLTKPYKNNFTFNNAVHKISDFGFHSYYLKWSFNSNRGKPVTGTARHATYCTEN